MGEFLSSMIVQLTINFIVKPIDLLLLYMLLIVKCFYLIFFQTPGLYKYYNFQNGPPSNGYGYIKFLTT